MKISEVTGDKKRYLSLLLCADEQENMIDRYLDNGTMYILTEGGAVRGECIVTDEGDGVLEIKNIAIEHGITRKGIWESVDRFHRRKV